MGKGKGKRKKAKKKLKGHNRQYNVNKSNFKID